MAPDPPVPSAVLDDIRVRVFAGNYDDAPVLLAAVEAALKRHRPVEYALRGGVGPGRYCAVCAGPPKWPCPEVQAITAALTGGNGNG